MQRVQNLQDRLVDGSGGAAQQQAPAWDGGADAVIGGGDGGLDTKLSMPLLGM
jgi:hypothetical protein